MYNYTNATNVTNATTSTFLNNVNNTPDYTEIFISISLVSVIILLLASYVIMSKDKMYKKNKKNKIHPKTAIVAL